MKIEGVVPPVMTAFDENGRLDAEGEKRLVLHVLEGGVSGVFILGSAGEFPMVVREDRAALIRASREAIESRGAAANPPLLVGCASCTTRETLELISEARDGGADAAVVLPPYYYKMGTSVLVRYFLDLIERSPLPVVIYENPHTTGNLLPVGDLVRLGAHENVAGLKDSSSDFARFVSLVNEFRRPVLQGDTRAMLTSLASGAAGIVPGIANLFPRECVDLLELARAGKLEAARRTQDRILAARESIFPNGKWREGLKYALSVRGLVRPHCAEPRDELTDAEKEQIRALVVGWGP